MHVTSIAGNVVILESARRIDDISSKRCSSPRSYTQTMPTADNQTINGRGFERKLKTSRPCFLFFIAVIDTSKYIALSRNCVRYVRPELD